MGKTGRHHCNEMIKVNITTIGHMPSCASAIFLPKMQTLNPITRLCPIKASVRTVYKMTGLYSPNLSRL